jgi:hypothetical protein
MAEVFLNCPQCQRQLRVTQELIGKPVKCPACGFMFSVAPDSSGSQPLPVLPVSVDRGTAEQGPGRGTQLETGPHGPPWELEHAEFQRARALILPPAIALLVATVIGFLGDIYITVVLKTNPAEVEKQFKAMNMNMAQGQQMSTADILRVTLVLHEVCAVISLMVILATTQMLRLRMYPLAILGCFLAMIDCGSYCCLIDLPLAVWCLVVLLRPEVRDAFHH